MIDIEQRRRRRSRRTPLYYLALLFALLTGVYASTITLGDGGPLEFGQGVFQVKVCDTWIGVNLVGVYINGVSYVGQIQVIGLDTVACNATNLQLSLYQTGSSTPMNIFGDGSNGATPENKVTLAVNSSYYSGGPKGRVQLITPAGVLTRNDSGYERIVPEQPGGTFNGNFDITFSNPLAQSSLVTSITLQSAPQ